MIVEELKAIESELKKMYPKSYKDRLNKITTEIKNRLKRETKQTLWRNKSTGEYLSLREYQSMAQAARRKNKMASEYLEELGYENLFEHCRKSVS